MIGIDVSSWQNGLSLAKNKEYLDFVIMKATEGVGFTDKCFNDFAVQSTELGLLQGCYHFARPDIHGRVDTMEDEAEWFVNVVDKQGLIGKAILVLDWEREPMDRVDLILAWLNKVYEMTGVRPFIYGSKSKLATTAFKELTDSWPIWMAAWPQSVDRKLSEAADWVTKYDPKRTTVPWLIWQFSSTGKLDGFNGHVDLNYTDIYEHDWKTLAEKVENPIPEPAEEKLSEDMQWAINEGFFRGYGNGKYGPKDPLTREQAATLIRNIIGKLYLQGPK